MSGSPPYSYKKRLQLSYVDHHNKEHLHASGVHDPPTSIVPLYDLQHIIQQYQSQPELLKLILTSKVEEDKRRAEEAKLRAKELDIYLQQIQPPNRSPPATPRLSKSSMLFEDDVGSTAAATTTATTTTITTTTTALATDNMDDDVLFVQSKKRKSCSSSLSTAENTYKPASSVFSNLFVNHTPLNIPYPSNDIKRYRRTTSSGFDNALNIEKEERTTDQNVAQHSYSQLYNGASFPSSSISSVSSLSSLSEIEEEEKDNRMATAADAEDHQKRRESAAVAMLAMGGNRVKENVQHNTTATADNDTAVTTSMTDPSSHVLKAVKDDSNRKARRRREMQAITKVVETREFPYVDSYFWKNNGNTVQKKTGCKSIYYKCSNSNKGCTVNKTVTSRINGEYLIKYRGTHLPECGKVERIRDL